ncbi:MAG: hypothetical protein ACTSU5_14025 [Promethearchaeota archaeon]
MRPDEIRNGEGNGGDRVDAEADQGSGVLVLDDEATQRLVHTLAFEVDRTKRDKAIIFHLQRLWGLDVGEIEYNRVDAKLWGHPSEFKYVGRLFSQHGWFRRLLAPFTRPNAWNDKGLEQLVACTVVLDPPAREPADPPGEIPRSPRKRGEGGEPTPYRSWQDIYSREHYILLVVNLAKDEVLGADPDELGRSVQERARAVLDSHVELGKGWHELPSDFAYVRVNVLLDRLQERVANLPSVEEEVSRIGGEVGRIGGELAEVKRDIKTISKQVATLVELLRERKS